MDSLLALPGQLLWYLLVIAVLVTIHEYGHFFAARRLGVKVTVFSIGFGQALWSRRGRDGVEYRISAIPLGGYVAMLSEREGAVPADQRDQCFERQPVWKRIVIFAAGPGINLLFTILAFWVLFMVGQREPLPILGPSTGIAAAQGLRDGDRITAVDGQAVASFEQFVVRLAQRALASSEVQLVIERQGATLEISLPTASADRSVLDRDPLAALGLALPEIEIEARIREPQADSPAAVAGLRGGDVILAVDQTPTPTFSDLATTIRDRGQTEQSLVLEVRRGLQSLEVTVQPRCEGPADARVCRIGVAADALNDAERARYERYVAVIRQGPIEAMGTALHRTWFMTREIVTTLFNLVTGRGSLNAIAGPLTIGDATQSMASYGLEYLIKILALISLSLAVLNLLPVPPLDGGHIALLAVEAVKGSPPSEVWLDYGTRFGLLVVLGLSLIAIHNDIVRFFG